MYRILSLFLVLALVGCGGEEKKSGSADDVTFAADDDGGGEVAAGAVGTAVVTGTVKWEGDPPRRRSIDMGADKYCVECHPEGVKSETAVIGPDGALAHVFVQVKDGLAPGRYATPSEAKVLDQSGCMYVPHVSGIQVRQTLEVRNSDSTLHNVHAVDFETRRDHFNFAQSKKGSVTKESFRRPGLALVKCEVHSWMTSYIHIVDHPFYAVSDEAGSFRIEGLPAGTFTLEAWHEKYGTRTATVTVVDGATAKAAFTFAKG